MAANDKVFTHDELKVVQAWLEQEYATFTAVTEEDRKRTERTLRGLLYEVDERLGQDHIRAYGWRESPQRSE